MIFADLLDLPYSERTNKICIDALRLSLPNTPLPVLEQFYSDHSRKHWHQNEYGYINISELKWELRIESASNITKYSCCHEFNDWVAMVEGRVKLFENYGWSCIDKRKEVVGYWQNYSTWILPPISLDGALMNNGNDIRLLEGHTRLGILKGLVSHGILGADSCHKIWLGFE